LALKQWTFTGSKTRRGRRVYFSDYVQEILARRQQQAKPGDTFVFENPHTEKPLTWVRRVMYRAEMVARGLPEETIYLSVKNEFSMHTLRHSFITYGMRAGIPLPVLQKMVGHAVEPRMRVTIFMYGHSTEDWEREGFQKIADVIQKLARKARPKIGAKKTAPLLVGEGHADPEAKGNARTRKKSLAAQKAAYLRYFRAKAAEDRRPRKRSPGPNGIGTIPGRSRQKIIRQMVAMRDAGKSHGQFAFLFTQQAMPISRSAVWQILQKADAAKRDAQRGDATSDQETSK